MRISAPAFAALAAILSVCPALAGEKTVTPNVGNMYCASCAPVEDQPWRHKPYAVEGQP
jgi:hypothetical protein